MAETRLAPWTPAQERIATVVIRLMTAANVAVFRWTGGWLGSRFLRGAPVCLVTTTGKRTGERRPIALIYLEDGANLVFVASKGGMSHHPSWYHNMMAHPEIEVEVDGTTRSMRVRRATAAEKATLWPRLCAIYPDYDDYQARTTRDIPVMIASPR
jgi:deazaflavin-dependent oxidoreductase (nitroreductase family)